jgi:hypothetical protein
MLPVEYIVFRQSRGNKLNSKAVTSAQILHVAVKAYGISGGTRDRRKTNSTLSLTNWGQIRFHRL